MRRALSSSGGGDYSGPRTSPLALSVSRVLSRVAYLPPLSAPSPAWSLSHARRRNDMSAIGGVADILFRLLDQHTPFIGLCTGPVRGCLGRRVQPNSGPGSLFRLRKWRSSAARLAGILLARGLRLVRFRLHRRGGGAGQFFRAVPVVCEAHPHADRLPLVLSHTRNDSC